MDEVYLIPSVCIPCQGTSKSAKIAIVTEAGCEGLEKVMFLNLSVLSALAGA